MPIAPDRVGSGYADRQAAEHVRVRRDVPVGLVDPGQRLHLAAGPAGGRRRTVGRQRERVGLPVGAGGRPRSLPGDRHRPVPVDAGHLGEAPDGAAALLPVGEPVQVGADQGQPDRAVRRDRHRVGNRATWVTSAGAEPDRPAGQRHHLALAADPVAVVHDRVRRRQRSRGPGRSLRGRGRGAGAPAEPRTAATGHPGDHGERGRPGRRGHHPPGSSGHHAPPSPWSLLRHGRRAAGSAGIRRRVRPGVSAPPRAQADGLPLAARESGVCHAGWGSARSRG